MKCVHGADLERHKKPHALGGIWDGPQGICICCKSWFGYFVSFYPGVQKEYWAPKGMCEKCGGHQVIEKC